jgi:hypothetical protein
MENALYQALLVVVFLQAAEEDRNSAFHTIQTGN